VRYNMKARPSNIKVQKEKVVRREDRSKTVVNSPLVEAEEKGRKTPDYNARPAKVDMEKQRKAQRTKTQVQAPEPKSAIMPEELGLGGEFEAVRRKKFKRADTAIWGKNDVSQAILSAKESLYDLRCEAKLCMNSSKRLLQDSQKYRRGSIASLEDYRSITSNGSQIYQDTLKELVDNLNDIKKRVINNEVSNREQLMDDQCLSAAIKRLEQKFIGENDPVLENQGVKVGCANPCTIF
jgi:hypothetical protein